MEGTTTAACSSCVNVFCGCQEGKEERGDSTGGQKLLSLSLAPPSVAVAVCLSLASSGLFNAIKRSGSNSASCLFDWLTDCLAAWLTDCLNGYGCWMACLLQLACKISVIHSFACFLCRLYLLCRLLMNRSTCRDALAVADNGQQLNKGNELKKKS